MQKHIYRIRPINSNTLDELEHSYLWFSRPCGFKGDVNDANIGAFVEDTEAIRRGITTLCSNFPFDKWYEKMGHIGICCFTSALPSSDELRHFPKCKKGEGISIEYNTAAIQDFFTHQSKIPIPPLFHKVIYDEEPTKIETCDEWSILWEKGDGFKKYKTIKNIFMNPRYVDMFVIKLLTRLNTKYHNQKEIRMFLGGCLIPKDAPNVLGYKIYVPVNTINRVIVYPYVDKEWVKILFKIENIKDKIEYLR